MSKSLAGKSAAMPKAQAAKAIRKGIPFKELDLLAHQLSLSPRELAKTLGISTPAKGTARTFPQAISQRIVRIVGICSTARKVFTSDAAMRDWMNSPAPALNGRKPIRILRTNAGTSDVESVLLGIIYGHVM